MGSQGAIGIGHPTGPTTDVPPGLREFIQNAIRDELQQRVQRIHFVELNSEPNKKREGDVVFADGTNWDPGSGRGLYVYLTSAWHLLSFV